MTRSILIALTFSLALTGCVKTPTRNTQMVDDRPGLAFDLAESAYKSYEVRIDGISYGHVGQYQEGQSFLRIIDGTHTIQLLDAGKVVFEQDVYLGTGAIKIIEVSTDE